MKIWARIIVSVGLLAVLVLVLPWSEALAAVAAMSGAVWVVVWLAFIAGHLLGSLKWRVMVNASRSDLRMRDAVRCYAAGLFANLCLPSIIGGDVLRATLAAQATRRPEAVVLGSVADRVLDIGALGILIVAGGLLVGKRVPGWAGAGLSALLLLGVVLLAVGLILAMSRPLRRWPRKVRRVIARSLVALRRLWRTPERAVLALALALVLQGTFVLLNAWIGHSIGIDVPLAVWFVVWPLAKVAGLMPISLGGLGVRDATQGALLAALGVPAAQGVVASLIWQSVLIGGGLTAGVGWWSIGRAAGETPRLRVERSADVPADHA